MILCCKKCGNIFESNEKTGCDYCGGNTQEIFSDGNFEREKFCSEENLEYDAALWKLREERDFAKKKAQYESAYMERYNNHIMTTSNIPDDYNVVKYCGIVSSQIVIGTGMWSEFVASVDDFFGSSTSPFAEKIRKSREILLERIRTESSERGGNAVIGIKFEYVSFENNIIGVMVDGTSVEIEKIKQ